MGKSIFVKMLYNCAISFLSNFTDLSLHGRLNRLFDDAYSRMLQRKLGKLGKDPKISRHSILFNPDRIFIGSNFNAMYGFRMEAWCNYNDQVFDPKIIIGDNVAFNTDCHIACINRIEIGNNVLFASRIFITDHFHGDPKTADSILAPVKRPLYSKGPVIIEDFVWVGESVSIMPGVRIGANAIVGANSVVTRNIEPYEIVAGVPAKRIGFVEKK